ncbi:MAG: hypothetical protein WAL50_21405 [Kineosporiaceae bacterium]
MSNDSEVVGIGWLPVAEVRWLRDVDPVADMYRDAGEHREPATRDGDELRSWKAFADGLKIAVDRRPGLTCLVPFDEGSEWQVWNIHKETSRAFLSFRSMLEYQVQIREPITDLEDFEEVIARASDGDSLALQRLTRTTVPQAVPRLIGLIADPWLGAASVMALGRIGTDAAVDVLARLEPAAAARALGVAGTERARDILAQWGAFYTLALLGDPRGPHIAAQRIANRTPGDTVWFLITALHAIAQSRDPRYATLLKPLLSQEPALALAAARALVWLGVPEGRARIAEIADHDGPERGSARRLLRIMDDGHLP